MRGKIQAKKPRGEKDTAIPKEKERTYGIDRLNLGDQSVELRNDPKLLPAQSREGQTTNKKYNTNSIKYEFNLLSNF